MKLSNITHRGLVLAALICCASLILPPLALAAGFLESGTPSFEIMDRESGLSNLSVSSILQDRYGFLWFGTQGGLNRFDGRQIITIRHNPFDEEGLLHNLIQTMYYHADTHELWIGTYQGVSRFLIDSNKFINYTVEESGLSNPVVVAITIDSAGTTWVGTLSGLNRFDPATNSFVHYEVPGHVVRALHIGSEGTLYVGSYEGLLYYDQSLDKLVSMEAELPSPFVMVIREVVSGVLELGLWGGGVVELDLSTNETLQHSYSDNRVYSLTTTADGTRWVGTWGGGLFADAPDGSTHHFMGEGPQKYLPHPVVYSLLEDHSGILWVGTNGGGLCKVNPRKSNYVRFSHDPDNPESLSPGKINSIFRDSRGHLWFSVYNTGLNRYDPQSGTMVKYRHNPTDPHSLPSDSVMPIFETRDGRILLGTAMGLAEYRHDTDTFTLWDVLPDDAIVYSLAEQGDYLWIGTYMHGLFRYHRNNGELEQFYKEASVEMHLSDNLVYTLLVDSKDRVWAGTNNGLNLLLPGENSHKVYRRVTGDRSQLASNTIRSIMEDSKGDIWIALVGGGVARYLEDIDGFASYTEVEGMSSNVITGILEGSDGRIWASTHDGLSVIDPSTGEIDILTPLDGIGGWEFNAGHFRDVDGSLMFGGIHGITVIPYMPKDTTSPPPKVYIASIDLFQTPVEPGRAFFNDDSLSFAAHENFLGFRFVALDYDAPDKIRYHHKLEGFDSDWISAGSRDYATYSNLPHGEYRLLVIAETARGVVSHPVSVTVTIATPWHHTTTAYLLYILAFVIIVFIVLKILQGQHIQQRNEQLADMNRQLETANEQLEVLSTRDPLTGLFNRRHLGSSLDNHLNLSRRSTASISLIMLDIDHFKEINDGYGHVTGDQVLQAISNTLRTNLPRATDFAARYGGDEFAVVLYETGASGALIVAKRLKEACEELVIVPESADHKVSITLSLGVVTATNASETDSETLIRAADKALYQAKDEGRNRISVGDVIS